MKFIICRQQSENSTENLKENEAAAECVRCPVILTDRSY
jgi:hypothetical protein